MPPLTSPLLPFSSFSFPFLPHVRGGKGEWFLFLVTLTGETLDIARNAPLALTLALEPGCRAIQLFPLADHLRIAEAAVFGPGPLPAEVPDPAAPLEKADFLLVSTHPDDEWVYLGGVYPTYGGERGYRGAVVYMTLPSFERAHESVNGLWIGGVRTHPFFLGFPDIRKKAPQKEKERPR